MPQPLPAPAASPTAPLAEPRTSEARRELGWVAGLFLLALAAHGRTLGFDWLEISDAPVRAFTSAREAWHNGGPGGLMLFLESGALVSRMVAVLLHGLASALAFGLARRLGLGRGAAGIVGAIFAVHPSGLESVAWLSQRGTGLGTVFLFLGLWLAQAAQQKRKRSLGSWTAASASLLFGFLCEPSLLLALPWMVLAARLLAREGGTLVLATVTLVFLCAALLLSGSWQGGVGFPPWTAPLARAPALEFWLGLLAALVALLYARRAPRVALGVLFYVLLSRSPQGASFGFALAVTAVGALLFRDRQRLGAGLAALCILALCLRTWTRLDDWRSEPARQASVLHERPDDPEAHVALGQWHLAHGRLSEAQRAFERTRGQGLAPMHLAELEIRRSLIPGKESHLLRAKEILEPLLGLSRARVPSSHRPWALLGEVYQRAGDLERALDHLNGAVRLDPWKAVTHTRLGMVHHQMGQVESAREAFERATELDPRSSEAWAGLGITHLQAGATDAAAACLARALALEPDNVEARAASGSLQERSGRLAEAEASYRHALGVNPDYVDALYSLGALLSAGPRTEEALPYLERVVRLRRGGPPHVRAFLECARLLQERGEVEEPRRLLLSILDFNPLHAEARARLAALPEEEAPR